MVNIKLSYEGAKWYQFYRLRDHKHKPVLPVYHTFVPLSDLNILEVLVLTTSKILFTGCRQSLKKERGFRGCVTSLKLQIYGLTKHVINIVNSNQGKVQIRKETKLETDIVWTVANPVHFVPVNAGIFSCRHRVNGIILCTMHLYTFVHIHNLSRVLHHWCYISKAGFPLGEFVRANKQKANVIGWWCRQCLSPANQVAFFSVRANKIAKWKTGLQFSFQVFLSSTKIKRIYSNVASLFILAGKKWYRDKKRRYQWHIVFIIALINSQVGDKVKYVTSAVGMYFFMWVKRRK